MSKVKHDIEFNGDHCVSTELYRPGGSHYVCNIVVEDADNKVRLYHVPFDVAETLRDQLSACLKEMLEDD